MTDERVMWRACLHALGESEVDVPRRRRHRCSGEGGTAVPRCRHGPWVVGDGHTLQLLDVCHVLAPSRDAVQWRNTVYFGLVCGGDDDTRADTPTAVWVLVGGSLQRVEDAARRVQPARVATPRSLRRAAVGVVQRMVLARRRAVADPLAAAATTTTTVDTAATVCPYESLAWLVGARYADVLREAAAGAAEEHRERTCTHRVRTAYEQCVRRRYAHEERNADAIWHALDHARHGHGPRWPLAAGVQRMSPRESATYGAALDDACQYLFELQPMMAAADTTPTPAVAPTPPAPTDVGRQRAPSASQSSTATTASSHGAEAEGSSDCEDDDDDDWEDVEGVAMDTDSECEDDVAAATDHAVACEAPWHDAELRHLLPVAYAVALCVRGKCARDDTAVACDTDMPVVPPLVDPERWHGAHPDLGLLAPVRVAPTPVHTGACARAFVLGSATTRARDVLVLRVVPGGTCVSSVPRSALVGDVAGAFAGADARQVAPALMALVRHWLGRDAREPRTHVWAVLPQVATRMSDVLHARQRAAVAQLATERRHYERVVREENERHAELLQATRDGMPRGHGLRSAADRCAHTPQRARELFEHCRHAASVVREQFCRWQQERVDSEHASHVCPVCRDAVSTHAFPCGHHACERCVWRMRAPQDTRPAQLQCPCCRHQFVPQYTQDVRFPLRLYQ